MIEESAYDELDRYVNGHMRGEELKGFLEKLNSDSMLRSEVEWIKSTMIAMSVSGKSVLKQHIANSMAGVFEKYSPSKNKKSFWKKWWWAVSLFVVAAAVGVAACKMWPVAEEPGSEHGTDQVPLGGGMENIPPMSDSAIKADSCAKLDSLIQQMESENRKVETVSVVLFGEDPPETYYDINEVGKTQPIYVTGSYAWQNANDKNVSMCVTLNVAKTGPFTYTLDSVLTLNSNYSSSKKMKFTGSGDTVIMTDSANNNYTLLRNRGNLPLVRSQDPARK